MHVHKTPRNVDLLRRGTHTQRYERFYDDPDSADPSYFYRQASDGTFEYVEQRLKWAGSDFSLIERVISTGASPIDMISICRDDKCPHR